MSGQVFTFIGSPALVRNAADQIIDQHSPERDSLTLQRMFVEDAQKYLPSEIMSFSMFAPSRVFVISKLEEATSDLLDFLLSYVTKSAKDAMHTLILIGESFPKKGPVKKLKAALQKNGTFQEFPIAKVRPDQYLEKLCAASAVQLSSKSKKTILQRVGSDLLSLENEIEKLSCFASGVPIDDRAVEELSATISETSIWDLMDAIVMKNAGRSMSMLYHMMEEGRAPHHILATITWQIRQLLELQESIQRKKSLPGSWIKKPHRKREHVIRLLQKNPIVPHNILSQLQKTNRLFNSSRAGDRRALELLVLELCYL